MKILSKILIVLAVLTVWGSSAPAQEEDIRIEPRHPRFVFFADQDQIFRFSIFGEIPPASQVFWTLNHEGRVIDQGESRLPSRSGSDQTTITELEITVPLPEINAGVTMPLNLSLTLRGNEPRTQLSTLNHPVFIYTQDPFALNRERLRELKVALYDTEKQTSKLFADLDIPYDEVFNLDALDNHETPLLIVGAGLDLQHAPGLMDKLAQLIKRGIPVLMLAPGNGEFVVPDMIREGATQVILSGTAVIKRLDKRLDTYWPPDGESVATAAKVKISDGELVTEWDISSKLWPWFELEYAEQTKFVVCGLDLVGKMKESPTPRYFLARLIEYMIREE